MENTRKCPNCDKILEYKTRSGFLNSKRTNKTCKSCSIKKLYIEDPSKNKGKNNPMYGTCAFNIWVEKLGIDEANVKMESLRKILSQNARKENNPMYGKPPGKGAGYGYSGIYKTLHFRSSYELCFLIEYEQKFNKLPKSAETSHFRCLGKNDIFYPDFFDNEHIYEIKPKKLLKANENKIKAIANFCLDNNLIFKIVTENDLNLPKNIKKWLIGLYDNGEIILSNKQLTKIRKS